MTSRPSHHPSKSADVVDFDTLVWPPPELRPVPSPKPYIVHTANNASYTVHPGQTMSQARRAAGIRRVGTPSSDSDESDSEQQPQPSTSRAPLIDNRPPLRATQPQAPNYTHPANGPITARNKGRYGCKDFPSGYTPTPRPLSPPVNRSITTIYTPRPSPVVTPDQISAGVPRSTSAAVTQSLRSSAKSVPPPSSNNVRSSSSRQLSRAGYRSRSPNARTNSEHHIPMDFFQPYIVSPSERGADQEDFYSPVMENGRVVSYARISGRSGLSPGGVIERGDFTNTSHSTNSSLLFDCTTRNRYGIGTESMSNDTSPLVILPEGLRVTSTYHSPSSRTHSTSARRTDHFSSSPSTNTQPTSRRSTSTSRDQPHPDIPASFKPTRRGYWNRRGDTFSPEGRIIPASPSQAYPPDLVDYPRYVLMNENGRILLPEKNNDRVAIWRTANSAL